jgi:hypothetical protein
MPNPKSTCLFIASLVIATACDDSKDSAPSPSSRFQSKEILVGQTQISPQRFSYSARTLDNGVAIVLNKIDPQNPTATREDMYVQKYAADGTLSWTKRFTSAYGMWGNSIFQSPDGDLLVAANRQKSPSFGDDESVIIRLTSDGNEKWKKSFSSDHGQIPFQIIELAGANILVDVEFLPGNYFLLLDSQGNEITKIQKSDLGCAQGFKATPTPDGDITIGSPNPAKVSVNGMIDFCNPITSSTCTEPVFISNSFKALNPDNYYMLGSSFIPVKVTEECLREDRSDLLVLQLDGNGTTIGEKTFNLAFNDYPKDFDFSYPDSKIVILSDGVAQNDFFDSKIHLTKLRHDLSLEWTEELNFSDSGLNQGFSVHSVGDQKYALVINGVNRLMNVNEIKLIFLTEK